MKLFIFIKLAFYNNLGHKGIEKREVMRNIEPNYQNFNIAFNFPNSCPIEMIPAGCNDQELFTKTNSLITPLNEKNSEIVMKKEKKKERDEKKNGKSKENNFIKKIYSIVYSI